MPEAPGGFGAALRRARLSARLTQDQLAHRSGLSTRAISDLERGRIRRPRNSSVDLLLTALAADEDVAARLVRLAGATDGALEHAREPLPDAGPAGPQPYPAWELPAAVPDFTGRDRDLASMTDRASAAMTAGRGAPVVLLVTGAPGVGKTALAVRLGHALAPAGSQVIQLFVELGGADGRLAPADGLRQMLSSLGVSDTDCPADQEQRTRLYRSLLYHRRALVLLDDAADEAQIRPLLPAGPGCVVVITSRRALEGLSPAIRMPLDVLPAGHARAFLGKVAGQERLGADEAAARQLVQLCGRLPLALRIAGNQLAARPHWPVASLVARLRDERTRLVLLAAGDLAVLRTFDASYKQLSVTAQVIFRRLPLLPGASFSTEMAGALCDSTGPAWPVVDELASASLIQATGPDRYRMHDLLRLYARGKLAELETPERIQAVEHRVRARCDRRHLEPACRPVPAADGSLLASA